MMNLINIKQTESNIIIYISAEVFFKNARE